MRDVAEALFQEEHHRAFSMSLERKEFWFWYFDQQRILTDMGLQLIAESPPTSVWRNARLMASLSRGLRGRRLFLKSPTNSFRIRALAKVFPDAKFLMIHRNGCEVVKSWGRRPYGFKQMGFEDGIRFFSRKWNETIDYLLDAATDVQAYQFRYEDMVTRPTEVMTQALRHCGLNPTSVALSQFKPGESDIHWHDVIPREHWTLMMKSTERNNQRLGYKPDRSLRYA
jgi:hypothetical protein